MVNFNTLLPAAALFFGAAQAHTRVFSLWVNDVDQGDGRSTYIRSPPSNSPVKDVSSPDIICNVANTAASGSVEAAAGDKISFEWYHDNRNDDIIDASHKGPITVYIADAASNGEGAVWTKLAEEGLSGGKWAVDNLIANGGKHDVTLPASLAAGDYLLRAEIIGLHEADADFTANSARGAQFYPSCAQVKVSGSGTTTPPGDFAFVGGYSPTDPGILFNLYGSADSYTIPGPAVWDGTGTGGSTPSAPASSAPASSAPASSAPAASAPAASSAPAATSAPVVPAPAATSTAVSEAPAPAPTGSAGISAPAGAVPTGTAPAPTTMQTVTRPAPSASAPAQSSQPAQPSQGSGNNGGSYGKSPEEINKCLDEVNRCIATSQSRYGGAVSFSKCESQRDACY